MLAGPRELLRAMADAESQKDVARRLGVSAQYVCDVLAGRREVSAKLAEKLGFRRVVVFEKATRRMDR